MTLDSDSNFCHHPEQAYTEWYLWNEPNQWIVQHELQATHKMRFCTICRNRQLKC